MSAILSADFLFEPINPKKKQKAASVLELLHSIHTQTHTFHCSNRNWFYCIWKLTRSDDDNLGKDVHTEWLASFKLLYTEDTHIKWVVVVVVYFSSTAPYFFLILLCEVFWKGIQRRVNHTKNNFLNKPMFGKVRTMVQLCVSRRYSSE